MGKKWVVKLDDRNLAEADKAKLEFFTDKKRQTKKQILPADMVINNGVIEVPKELLDDVKEITLSP